jgi:hypothetical protein
MLQPEKPDQVASEGGKKLGNTGKALNVSTGYAVEVQVC